MAGKSYIKVGYYDWDRIKKMYIKTGGQTWTAIRKSYVKTSTGWRKVFDTASNRPFIAGNDIPKIRLNTFRTGSTYNPTGTLDDPVDPLVEAPPVQQMGPSWTSPTYGWPYESLGRHLWGYDGTWTSGNGSAMTFVYTWLYNLTGNSNDNTAELNATSTTGRTDMLTNLSSHLGQSDGDYFDKNFLTFRVTATNSAGSASAESAPVYIVREVPTGSITMVSPSSAFTNSTMSATFTYSNNWYNKTNISNSYIEWFAVNSIGEALTNSNRVQIEYLSSIAATGTTTKSGTAFHTPTIANKYYYVKMTLNNSGTENAVIAITGFTPKSSVTSQANKTVATGTLVPAPTSLTATSNRGDGVLLQWSAVAGANYYEIYWQSTTGAGASNQSTFADFGTNNSITTTSFLDTTISPGATRYYRVRARIEATSNGNNCSDWFPATSSTGTSGFRVKPGPITNPTAYSFATSTGYGYFTTGTNTDSVQYKLQGITIPIATSVNTISTTSSYPYKVTLNPSSLFTERTWNYDTYSPSTTYYVNNTVWYAGNQYQAIRYVYRSVFPYDEIGFSGFAPTNTTYWTRITTVTYSVGDYVNYNGTRYYVKISGNGNYPNNTTYWSNTLGTWRFDFTPYFSTAAGDTVYSNSTKDLTLSHTAATEPMTMAAGVSFDNITSSSFRANYTTGLYANLWYVDIYNTSTNARISGTPYLTHRSNVTAYTDTVSSGVVPLTNYTYSITPRYYYSIANISTGMPDVFDNGTGSSNSVTTPAALSAPSSTSIVSMSRLNDTTVRAVIGSSGGSGPYYQLYWTTASTPPATATYDAASTTSTVTEDSAFSTGFTYYFYIRSSSENLGNTITGGTGTSGTYSNYGPATGAASYTFAQPSGSVSVSPASGTAGTTQFTATPSVSAAPAANISYQWQYNDQGSLWLAAPNSITSPFNTTSSTYTPPSNYTSTYGSSLRCQITANNGVGTQLVTTSTVTVAAALTKLATPTNVNATDTRTDGVNVTWTAVSGAAYYGVWYGSPPSYNSNPDFGGPNSPTLITGTSYLDTAITAGSSRDYYVQAFRTNNPAGTKSEWGGPNNGTRLAAPTKLATPTGVDASDNRTDGVNITWNAVSGASYYGVWWGGAPGYDSTPDFQNIFGTSYLDTGITAGSSRDYYVQAFASGNPTGTKSDWGGPNNGTRTSAPATPAPVLSSLTGNNSLTVGGTFNWSFTNSPTSYSILVTGPSGTVYTTSNSYNYYSTSFSPGYDGSGWQGTGNYTIYVNATNGQNSQTASLTTYMS